MAKISDKNEYPVVSEMNVTLDDFVIGTVEATGQTRVFPFRVVKAVIEGNRVKVVTLTTASSYQHNDFIGANTVYGFTQGQEIKTGGMIDTFNSTTGEVTFTSSFTPFSGEVIFVIA